MVDLRAMRLEIKALVDAIAKRQIATAREGSNISTGGEGKA
jgi:hypothetical protein